MNAIGQTLCSPARSGSASRRGGSQLARGIPKAWKNKFLRAIGHAPAQWALFTGCVRKIDVIFLALVQYGLEPKGFVEIAVRPVFA